MNKILDLLKQMGASPELQKQIMEALESYKESVQTKLEEDFKQRVSQARKVCVEAVDNEKRELAKKIEVFLEARINTIQKEAAKQAAIGESEAVRLLRGAKALFEGIQIDSNKGSGQAAIAETEEVKQLRIQNKQLKENLEKINLKAQRANTIALKALERNKLLEGRIAPAAKRPPVVESKTPAQPKQTMGEQLRKTSTQPKTARPALTESVVRAPATAAESADPSIAAIASKLDGSPAFIA
jgi:hypothetical protein